MVIPVLNDELSNAGIAKLSCGYYHSVAISSKGVVFVWGKGVHGELGTGKTVSELTPVALTSLQSPIKDAACGGFHTVLVDSTNRMWSFGASWDGRLGVETTMEFVSVPQEIPFEYRVVQVSCGWDHTLALTESREVYTWGKGAFGQLGLGPKTSHTSTPTRVGFPSECSQIACGGLFSMAITKDNVFSWGLNSTCQLGHGKITCTAPDGSKCITHKKKPVQCTPMAIDALKGTKLRSISCGLNFACAICDSVPARVLMWGAGGTTSPHSSQHNFPPLLPTPTPSTSSLRAWQRHANTGASARGVAVVDSPQPQAHRLWVCSLLGFGQHAFTLKTYKKSKTIQREPLFK
eukprot:TRINITY_DN425_c0_g2_i1.p1 TRINITY_DN425_c0_g2~~TRINITY_DN425_c0_g2_i1.p1  ORF type:complete len:349 (+),score=55.43 TRINITY_DN425_c0_g2_i1:176-1222(+)